MDAMTVRKAADFPEDWNAPVDGGGTFMHDPMHFPHPVSPLSNSALGAAFGIGFTTAAREYRTPIKQVSVKSRNMHHFERFEMFQPADEDEARLMGEAAEAALKPVLGRMLERWNEEHLPALREHLARLRSINVDDMAPADVAALLDDIDAIHSDIWTIHFRIALPMLMGMEIFDEFYADVFGGELGDGHGLLLGVASESVKAGLRLYDLSVQARALGLEPVFHDGSPGDMLARLEQSEAGRAFTAELRGYLDEYGLRQDLFDLATPTWQENPTFALSNVRNCLLANRDERAAYSEKQQAAETALTEVRAALALYPEAVRGQFEGLLQIARAGSFLQEEHNFYIDQQALALLRLVYLRIGARLVEDGLLTAADDVFMLQTDELRNLFANPDTRRQGDFVRALVQTRREQFALAHSLTPPPFIGAPPAGPPPDGNPMQRAMGRFFGGPPQQAEGTNQLKGNAGSRGVASGVARVARTLAEAGALQPGEILVAVTTMPAWTPLFGVAAAVVTETGGPLSHCAIVAREYGIPAVVGAHGATRTIMTGQRVTVDGGRGLVTIDV